MRCANCYRPATVTLSYTSRVYCKKHFEELITKRVRKDIRLHQPFDLLKNYCLEDEHTLQGAFVKKLLEELFAKRLKLTSAECADAKISPVLLEEDVSRRFEAFLSQNPSLSQVFKPLRSVSVEEFSLLTGKKLNQAMLAHPLLTALEHKQHGSFFAVRKILEKRE